MDIKEQGKEVLDRAVDGTKDAVQELSEQLTLAIASAPKRGVLDVIQEKVVSRKLLVFIVATILMWYGLDAETWGMIAMTYIGGQTAIDFAKVWRNV